MGRLMRAVLGAAAAGALAVSASAIAHADNEYAGQTYAQAQQAIQQAGGTDTIATVVGDQLPTTQCRVTGSRTAGFLDSSGNTNPGRILLDLNCNADQASGGTAGNAAAGPQAQAQDQQDRQAQQQAEAQQNQGDELLQSQEVPLVPGQVP